MAAKTGKKSGAARRTEILASAASLLARDGAGGLSLRAIANEVGIKLASLQYYFPTFSSLIEALMQDMVSRHTEGLQRADKPSSLSSRSELEAALRWLAVDVPMSFEEGRLEVQFWALAQLNKDAQSALTSYHGAYVDLLDTLIANAVPNLAPREAQTRATLIASLLEGSVLFITLDSGGKASAEDYEALYQAALLIALHGQ